MEVYYDVAIEVTMSQKAGFDNDVIYMAKCISRRGRRRHLCFVTTSKRGFSNGDIPKVKIEGSPAMRGCSWAAPRTVAVVIPQTGVGTHGTNMVRSVKHLVCWMSGKCPLNLMKK